MNTFDSGRYSALVWLSSVYHGKQYYFLQLDSDLVYSRDSGKCMTLEEAIEEFAKKLEND